jgi:hypothetical protein
MKRLAGIVAVAAVAVGLTVPAGAMAASGSERECDAIGGTYTPPSEGGPSCVVTEEGKNPKFDQEITVDGQGNLGNKRTVDEDCDGTGSDKCPPGQFN